MTIAKTLLRPPIVSVPAVLGAAVVGFLAGGLTSYLQGVLSADWNTVANSGAIWSLLAAGAAVVLGRQPVTAMLVGLLVLVGEVTGYYAYVTQVRHLPVLRAEEVLWTLAALWIGPVAGFAAHQVRHGRSGRRLSAVLSLLGVLGGEGWYLWHVAGVAGAGRVEVLVAAAGALAAQLLVPVPPRNRAIAVAIGFAVAVLVYLAYRQPLLA
jgi:hypothetical protein